MLVYYTHEYHSGKGESHSLLETAITDFLCRSCDAEDEHIYYIAISETVRDFSAASKASRLVASMKKGDCGKPYISGFHPFSISHSNNTWAVLIAGSECGLDIQYPRKADPEGISRRFFAPEDAARVSSYPDEFFRLWARREALIKEAGSSVADSDAPSVLGSEARHLGITCRIADIALPGAPGLYAAICYKVDD